MDKATLAQYYIEEKFDKKKVRKNLITQIEEDFYFQIENAYTNFQLYVYKGHDHESIFHRLYNLLQYPIRDWIAEIYLEVVYLNRVSIQAIVGRFIDRVDDQLYRKLHALTDLVVIAAQEDIFDIELTDAEDADIMCQAHFEFDDDTYQYITDTMYLPPMLCKPKKIRNVHDCAYLTRKEPCLLKPKFNLHDKPMNFDLVNKLNSIPLKLDTDMLEYEETPSKPIDTKLKRKNFNALKSSSRKVYDMILDEGNLFYLTWKPDKRGRVYSQGYHINLQATDYKKSLISFAEEVIIPKD